MLFKFLKKHFWFSKYFNVNIGIYRSEIWPAKVLIRTGSEKYYDAAESRKKYFVLTIVIFYNLLRIFVISKRV